MSIFNNTYNFVNKIGIAEVYRRDVPFMMVEYIKNTTMVDISNSKMISAELGLNTKAFIVFKESEEGKTQKPFKINIPSLSDTHKCIIIVIDKNILEMEPKYKLKTVLSIYRNILNEMVHSNRVIDINCIILTMLTLDNMYTEQDLKYLENYFLDYKYNKDDIHNVVHTLYRYISETLELNLFNPVTDDTIISDLINCAGWNKLFRKDKDNE